MLCARVERWHILTPFTLLISIAQLLPSSLVNHRRYVSLSARIHDASSHFPRTPRHRTYEPLCYPPSTLALASLYLAALLAEPCTLPGSAPTYAASLSPLEKARWEDVRLCRGRFELGAREWVEDLCSTEEDVEREFFPSLISL